MFDMSRPANDEMVAGYSDGHDLTCPEPSANRSESYRHGFAVGRAEKSGKGPLASASVLRERAEIAMQKDDAV